MFAQLGRNINITMTGLELKEIREKLRLSQDMLGSKIGITGRQIRRLESGENKIRQSIEILIKNLERIKD